MRIHFTSSSKDRFGELGKERKSTNSFCCQVLKTVIRKLPLQAFRGYCKVNRGNAQQTLCWFIRPTQGFLWLKTKPVSSCHPAPFFPREMNNADRTSLPPPVPQATVASSSTAMLKGTFFLTKNWKLSWGFFYFLYSCFHKFTSKRARFSRGIVHSSQLTGREWENTRNS